MLEKLLTVNWKLLFLTSKSMGLTQFILWAETLSDHPKAKIKANMYNWRPFLSFFLSVFDKEAATGCPRFPSIIWFINRISGRQDEGIKMGYLRPTILLWVDNVSQFWVACKLVKSTSVKSSGNWISSLTGGAIWF